MSDNIETTVSIEEYEEDDYSLDDFSFVLGPDGELKSFTVPEHLMSELPKEVKKILLMFGIEDIYDLGNRTIH